MVEILKQPQFKPMHVIDQVVVIYAGVNGFVDAIPLDKVRDWEGALLAYLHSNHQAFWDTFAAKKELSKEIEDEVKRILAQFNEAYLAGKTPGPALTPAAASLAAPHRSPNGEPDRRCRSREPSSSERRRSRTSPRSRRRCR